MYGDINNLRSLLLSGVLLIVVIWSRDLTSPRPNDTAVKESAAFSLPNSIPETAPENILAALPNAADLGSKGPAVDKNIPEVILDSKAAFAVTQNGRVLYQKNADEPLPIASISKLMTALVALDSGSLTDSVPISVEAIKAGGDSGFVAGETLSLHDAILAMLVASSNDAAAAIAERFGGDAFLQKMNDKAKALGMTTAHFANPHGLAPPGNLSSAHDVARLLQAALANKFLNEGVRQEKVSFISIEGRTHVFENTDVLLSRLPGALGGKTGFTMESKGTLVFAFSPAAANGHRALVDGDDIVITAVLGSNDRFDDTEALARWIAGAYRW